MRVIIADDHEIARTGLMFCCKKVWGNNVEVLECSDISTLIKTLKEDHNLTMAIVDIFLSEKSTLEYMNIFRVIAPQLPILVVSVGKDEIYGMRAMAEGANGYVNKTEKNSEICEAIRKVGEGGMYMSEAIQKCSAEYAFKAREMNGPFNPFNLLSTQEFNVLQYLFNGKTTSEISRETRLSPTTISTFKSRIYDKLKTSKLNEILKMAREFKVLDDH